MNRKTSCVKSSALPAILEAKVEETVKEVVRATLAPKTEVTLETLPSFFEDIHNLLWNRAGLNPERALEHMIFFFSYRLIEQQADILSLPQDCRWSFIASIKNENDLFEAIKRGVTGFRMKPETKPFFKPHEIQKADIVYEIVQQINRISLTTLRETDTLGDIFEHMLGRGMSTMADEGQYFTNRSICKLAFKLAFEVKGTLRRPDGSLCTFGDWFCGTGGFPAEFVKGVKHNIPDVDWTRDAGIIHCQDMNLSSVTTTLLNMLILTGIPFNNSNIRGSNSFYDPITMGPTAPFPELSLDYCFMNPPYGGDKSKSKEYKFAYTKKVKGDDGKMTKRYVVNQEIQSIGIEDDDKVSAGVQLAMATLSGDGGICSLVLWDHFFFGAGKKCVELRKKIAEEYKIHYVVDIASGAFINTGTKTSMIVFQKGVGPTEKVSFIGLNETLLIEATLEDLRIRNYSLNYKQYIPQTIVAVEGFEIKKLSEIASDIIFGFMISSDDYCSDGVPVIKTKNIKDKIVTYPIKDQNIIRVLDDKYKVIQGDLLIVLGGSPGSNGIWNFKEDAWLNQDCAKIAIENEITKKYVFFMLESEIVKSHISSNITKTTIGHISRDVVRDIPIPLPSLERQAQIVEAIDGWTQLAHQEEVALGILEKQVMFQVKEMGRGKELVKLGDVCDIFHGKRITKKDNLGTIYPVYGGGDDTFKTDSKNREGFTCKISRFGISENNCVQTIYGDYWLMDSGFTISANKEINDPYIFYWLLQNKARVYSCGRATAQMNMDMESFKQLEIPLPPIEEQMTLQSDFDEIRHKHTKIAEYKAKAQEAIIRLIPGSEVKV